MVVRPRRGDLPLADSPTWLYAEAGRLRAPWRLMTFGAVLFLAQGIVESFLGPVFGVLSRIVGEPIAAYPWVMLVGVIVALGVAVRSVDDQSWEHLGAGAFSWRASAMLRSTTLGFGAMLAVAAVLALVGVLRFESTAIVNGTMMMSGSWAGTAARLLLLLAPAALWEELIFRGYLWRVAADAAGARVALVSSSLAFSAVHFLNPGAGLRTGAIVLLAGLCLGQIRERLHSVPAAWGAHLAWNWMMAALLHAPVSGLSFAAPDYRAVLTGPDWLSGGVWGPEGSVIAAVVMMIGLAWSEWPHLRGVFRTRTGRTSTATLAVTATRGT